MKNHTRPIWVWAGAKNLNSPTGIDSAAVVIEPNGTVRAAQEAESNENVELLLVASAGDLDPIRDLIGDPEALFSFNADLVTGWNCTLSTLSSLVAPAPLPVPQSPVSSCVVATPAAYNAWAALPPDQKKLARQLAQLRGHLERIRTIPAAAPTGSSIEKARWAAQQQFYCGGMSAEDAGSAIETEIQTLNDQITATYGPGTIEKFDIAILQMEGHGDDIDDLDDPDEDEEW
jgi:hypothetical protein